MSPLSDVSLNSLCLSPLPTAQNYSLKPSPLPQFSESKITWGFTRVMGLFLQSTLLLSLVQRGLGLTPTMLLAQVRAPSCHDLTKRRPFFFVPLHLYTAQLQDSLNSCKLKS